MTPTLDPPPPVGTRAQCARCGRTVWLAQIAITGHLSTPPNAPVYGWRARKGSAPPTARCPVQPGSKSGPRHQPAEYALEYFGPTQR